MAIFLDLHLAKLRLDWFLKNKLHLVLFRHFCEKLTTKSDGGEK